MPSSGFFPRRLEFPLSLSRSYRGNAQKLHDMAELPAPVSGSAGTYKSAASSSQILVADEGTRLLHQSSDQRPSHPICR